MCVPKKGLTGSAWTTVVLSSWREILSSSVSMNWSFSGGIGFSVVTFVPGMGVSCAIPWPLPLPPRVGSMDAGVVELLRFD